MTLNEYGINSQRSSNETGVWIDVGTPFARKICAMGIRSSRWVTMHGFALIQNTNDFLNALVSKLRQTAIHCF